MFLLTSCHVLACRCSPRPLCEWSVAPHELPSRGVALVGCGRGVAGAGTVVGLAVEGTAVGVRVVVATAVGLSVIVGTNVDVDDGVKLGAIVGAAVRVLVDDGLEVEVDVIEGVIEGNALVAVAAIDVAVLDGKIVSHFLFSSRSLRKSSSGLHGRSSIRIHLPRSFRAQPAHSPSVLCP